MLPTSLLLLSLALSVHSTYDDALARNHMILLSSAAFSNTSQLCLTKHFPGARVVKQVTVPCDHYADPCSAFVFVDDASKAFGIAFRGSSNQQQIDAEIEETLEYEKIPFVSGGKAVKFFSDAFYTLWEQGISDAFVSQAAATPQYTCWITGHSLGAALASLAANHIVAKNLQAPDNMLLYTFGQPRTGDREYADVTDETFKNAYRVTHTTDIIPHVPFPFMGYQHHKTEIFYDNSMDKADFQLCLGQEDPSCSIAQSDLNMEAHRHYYGIQVPMYGQSNCGVEDGL